MFISYVVFFFFPLLVFLGLSVYLTFHLLYSMFQKFLLDLEINPFQELLSVQLEEPSSDTLPTSCIDEVKNSENANPEVRAKIKIKDSGRKAAILVDCNMAGDLIPLIRTTTSYHQPPQRFTPLHYDIINRIRRVTGNRDISFNNALLEFYTSMYGNMGWHSDQSLDFVSDDSFICVCSWYNTPVPVRKRVLKIKKKGEGKEKCGEIVLDHNSIILFSTSTNQTWLHKIMLQPPVGRKKSLRLKQTPLIDDNTQWVGLTFRLSKTFVQFNGAVIPYIYPAKTLLTRATEEQAKEFRKYKGLENLTSNFKYPEITYSTSPSDFLPLSASVALVPGGVSVATIAVVDPVVTSVTSVP